MAKRIDGKAFAQGLRERVGEAVSSLQRDHGFNSRPGRRAGRRGSGKSGLCTQQGQADARGRHEVL